MANFTVLDNCKQSSRKSRAPFQNDVAMATTVASTLIQFNFLTKNYIILKVRKFHPNPFSRFKVISKKLAGGWIPHPHSPPPHTI